MRRLSRWMMVLLVVGAGIGVAAWALAPIWPEVGFAVRATVAMLALWGMHHLLLYCESRGWIFYVKGRGSYGGLGVTSNFLNMYDPSRRHLQEVVREQEWRREEDDDGDS